MSRWWVALLGLLLIGLGVWVWLKRSAPSGVSPMNGFASSSHSASVLSSDSQAHSNQGRGDQPSPSSDSIPGGQSYQEVQRTLNAVADINRINRLNQTLDQKPSEEVVETNIP